MHYYPRVNACIPCRDGLLLGLVEIDRYAVRISSVLCFSSNRVVSNDHQRFNTLNVTAMRQIRTYPVAGDQ